MSKQSDRVTGTVTEAEIDQLCSLAKIPHESRTKFAESIRTVINIGQKLDASYRTPDPAVPLMAEGNAISGAAFKLLDAIDKASSETRSFMQGLLLAGELADRVQAVRDLQSVSIQLVQALQFANGRDRSGKGAPSKTILSPGLPAADLLAFDIFAIVGQSGGKLTLNETGSERRPGGSMLDFFDLIRPMLPEGFYRRDLACLA
jgi:hypothetical protein